MFTHRSEPIRTGILNVEVQVGNVALVMWGDAGGQQGGEMLGHLVPVEHDADLFASGGGGGPAGGWAPPPDRRGDVGQVAQVLPLAAALVTQAGGGGGLVQ